MTAEPDAREPRLVLADWYLSREDPRGELMILEDRLQELSPAERERHAALLAQHERDWLAELGLERMEGRLRGGLLEHVRLRAPLLQQLAPRLASQPVRSVLVDGPLEDVRGLLGSLARFPALSSLGFHHARFQPDQLAELAGARGLRELRSLELAGNAIGPDGAHAFALHARLPQLTYLGLMRSRLEAAGLWALLSCEGLPSLASLHLGKNELGPEGARALASRSGLRSLQLDRNELGPEGVRLLCRGPSRYHKLVLSGNALGPTGALALAQAPGLGELAHLHLRLDALGPEGARALAHSPHLRALESLELCDNALGDEGMIALCEGLPFPHLVSIDLSENALTSRAARALAHSPALVALREVRLPGNALGDEGARAVAGSTITHATLDRNEIGPEGARALAARPWGSLELGGNPIGEEGARALLQIPRIGRLWLDSDEVGAVAPELRARFGPRVRL